MKPEEVMVYDFSTQLCRKHMVSGRKYAGYLDSFSAERAPLRTFVIE